jgi:hypothetical protein
LCAQFQHFCPRGHGKPPAFSPFGALRRFLGGRFGRRSKDEILLLQGKPPHFQFDFVRAWTRKGADQEGNFIL